MLFFNFLSIGQILKPILRVLDAFILWRFFTTPCTKYVVHEGRTPYKVNVGLKPTQICVLYWSIGDKTTLPSTMKGGLCLNQSRIFWPAYIVFMIYQASNQILPPCTAYLARGVQRNCATAQLCIHVFYFYTYGMFTLQSSIW